MTASVFIATSLDGFIARLDGQLDWLPDAPEDHGYTTFMATIDAIVMGRNTYRFIESFGSWPFGTTPVIVLTTHPSTVSVPDGADVQTMAGTPHEIVARLAERGLTRLYIDGGDTVQRFIADGLIERLIITRIPVLLGTGIPLFGPLPHDVRWTHVATQSFPSGLVQSEYRIAT